MKFILVLVAMAFILGLRPTLSLIIGGFIGYMMGHLFVLSGTGRWVIPVLTLVTALALSGRIRKLIDDLFF